MFIVLVGMTHSDCIGRAWGHCLSAGEPAKAADDHSLCSGSKLGHLFREWRAGLLFRYKEYV